MPGYPGARGYVKKELPMKTVAEKIRELKEKEGQIKGMGGAKAGA